MTNNQKIIRVSTVPISLNILLKGQLKFLSQYFEIIGISSKGNDLDEVSRRETIKTFGVDMERGISPFKDLVSLLKLYRHFKNERPAIVHSITPKAGLLSMAAAYFAKVPIRVHTFTGLIFPSKKGLFRLILLNMDRLTCFFATNVYPEGKGVKQDLINAKVTNKKLRVIANGNVNGIDTEYFDPFVFSESTKKELRAKLKIPHNHFLFVFVGRLVKDKGINELVAAFKRLNNSTYNISLLLVGPFEEDLDPLFPETLHIIENEKNVYSVGYQNDVRPYFAMADALVFPSYREGFPNVVMQAGAMGLPSIVTDINGCNEIITHGVNGLIITPKNIE